MMDFSTGPMLPSMTSQKFNTTSMDDHIRFTMNDLIDFGNLDGDAEQDDGTNHGLSRKTNGHSGLFNFSNVDGMEEYQAADGNNMSLDDAVDAAIFSLPKMMHNNA